VPGLQVVESDGADGGQLRLARVGAVGAVDQLGRFALGDARLVVVAADDAGGFLLLGQLQLFLVEFGMQEQVEGQREDLVGIAFERVPGEAVESSSPSVSMCAALASSRSSSASPSILAVPLVRHAWP
jgi:hypothetical protein